MNFFEHQDRARRNSRRLVLLFLLAVVLIVLAVNLAVSLCLFSFFEAGFGENSLTASLKAHGIVSGITLLVIAGASWYRMSKLRSGGDRVALDLGGVWVDPDSQDPVLRRLCNVVEEMSIASGVPTPHIYVLEAEKGINAFAAGYSVEDAAIAVSRGALDQLTRDELQGVIAHEFTHILNGDMRMNIRMMGILYGILAISVIGRGFLHSGGRRRSVIHNQKQGGGGGHILGLALLLVGYIGVFFGRLIKAGVSRQREFLADAHAVQFTRNPDGIGGALKKIGGLGAGSHLRAAEREEVSHMLFASGQKFWVSALATHPPLEARIRAIDPSFQPEDFRTASGSPKTVSRGARPAFDAGENPWAFLMGKGEGETIPTSAFTAAVMQDVETPDPERLDQAEQVMMAIPDALLRAARSTTGVLVLFPALLLGREKGLREAQMALVREVLGDDLGKRVESLIPEAESLHPLLTLPLTDLAFPVLRQVEASVRERLSRLLKQMILLDGQVTVFEYCLVRLLKRRLEETEKGGGPDSRRLRGGACRDALIRLFSVLAWQGHESETQARRAFLSGISRMLPMDVPAYEVPLDWARDMDLALGILDSLDVVLKGELVQALLVTASSDGSLSLEEAELLRVICACLCIPTPPLLPQVVV
jgi:Zn-dependent protease with chaperone function